MQTAEFLQVTPRQLGAFFEHQARVTQQENMLRDAMMAKIVAMVANTGFRSFEEPRHPHEFMHRYPALVSREKPTRVSRKRQQDLFTQRMKLAMERAVAYQRAQVERGIA